MDNRSVRKSGFSLLELVIVIAIIGIVSAIAVPRVSRGSSGAADVALRRDLAVLRNAIHMYAAEHGSTWPGADGKRVTFIKQLTKKTDASGDVGTIVGVHVFGPYLQSIPPIPVGPNRGATKVRMKNKTPLTTGINEGRDAGWVYNYDTGEIIANTDDLDDNGVGYETY